MGDALVDDFILGTLLQTYLIAQTALSGRLITRVVGGCRTRDMEASILALAHEMARLRV